jgi:Fructosamine kinase
MPESFFEAYHDNMPKTEPVEQYELRLDLYLLFHHLNHTVLFGVSGFAIDVLKAVLSHHAGTICRSRTTEDGEAVRRAGLSRFVCGRVVCTVPYRTLL